jgi:amino acid adenylation domain-containing protein
MAATMARYTDRAQQLLGWSDGGQWRSVHVEVDFAAPMSALIAQAARALHEPAGAELPRYGIGRSGAPHAGMPGALTMTADGFVHRVDPHYDEEDAARFAGHVAALARASSRDVAIGRIPMVSDAEMAAMYPSNAGNVVDDPATLPRLIEEQVRRHPDAVAVRAGQTALTYAQLWSRSGELARAIRAENGGALVGVWADRSRAELMVALLGVLRSGAAYVALEPSYPQPRLDAIAKAAGLRAVVDGPYELGRQRFSTDEAVAESSTTTEDSGLDQAAPDDLAYVMFTSGSTGDPKGVMIEHRSVVNLLTHMAQAPGLHPGETMVGVTTPAFDLSVPDLFLPLVTGATLVLIDRDVATDGVRLGAELDRIRPHVMQATPATWRMLFTAGWGGAPQLRVVCGGEAYDATLARALARACAGVWNFYGPTETTVWSTSTQLGADSVDPISIGLPLRGTSVYVLDSRGMPVPAGVRGELHIAGAGVARGYLGRPDLTGEAFVDCPFGVGDADSVGSGTVPARMYRTGDLCRVTAAGELSFAGRRDLQVKINGYRVELGEVEAVVSALPGVGQAVAVAKEGSGSVTRLVCYVTGDVTPEGIRTAAAATLAPQAVPSVVVVLDAFPLTPNGKVNRAALPEPPERVGAALEGPFEELVAEVWAEVLGRGTVYADDDIFALGAYSLDIGRIAMRLTAELSLEVGPALIFRHSTVRSLAAELLELVALVESDVLIAAEH